MVYPTGLRKKLVYQGRNGVKVFLTSDGIQKVAVSSWTRFLLKLLISTNWLLTKYSTVMRPACLIIIKANQEQYSAWDEFLKDEFPDLMMTQDNLEKKSKYEREIWTREYTFIGKEYEVRISWICTMNMITKEESIF